MLKAQNNANGRAYLNKSLRILCVTLIVVSGGFYGFLLMRYGGAVAYAETYATDVLSTQLVTPEMFGAVGDGEHDDTNALQTAFQSGAPVLLMPKEYLTTSTLVITGETSIFDAGSTINYTGKEAAVRFTEINNHCDVSFGSIIAKKGTGIEFFCNSRDTRCQYVNLSFNVIHANKYCIYFNREIGGDPAETGWLNEIHINGGRFRAGQYGVYADAKGTNSINNIKLTNVSFESIYTGAYLTNNCTAWSFINTRTIEMTIAKRCIFKTDGLVTGLTILLGDRFDTETVSFSRDTSGIIIAPIQETDLQGNMYTAGNIAEIVDGSVKVYAQSMSGFQNSQEVQYYTDMDAIITPGNYYFPYTQGNELLYNCPTDMPFTLNVSNIDGSSIIIQEVKIYDSAAVFKRAYSSYTDSFSSWKRNATEDDIFNLQQEIINLRNMIEQLQ